MNAPRSLHYPHVEPSREPESVYEGGEEYRAKLRADARRYCRWLGVIDPVTLAEMERWIDEVGPAEQRYLREHGVEIAITQPQREEPDELELPLEPLHTVEEWARMYVDATPAQRKVLAPQIRRLDNQARADIRRLVLEARAEARRVSSEVVEEAG